MAAELSRFSDTNPSVFSTGHLTATCELFCPLKCLRIWRSQSHTNQDFCSREEKILASVNACFSPPEAPLASPQRPGPLPGHSSEC